MKKLSVVLATYNEEENIERCLRSVMDIVDEVVVVDGSSTDKTRQIAKGLGAKVIKTTNKPMFHINKQMAIDNAKGDWILQLDADEVVSSKLAEEIKKVINLTEEQIRNRRFDVNKQKLFDRHLDLIMERDGNFKQSSEETVAFFVPRLNVFLGHPMKYGGVYPDGVIRLIKKEKAYFPCKSVHEQITVEGRVGWLENDLFHYNAPTFARYVANANRYTTLSAKELKSKEVKMSLGSDFKFLIWKPVLTFCSIFFRHKGFQDGFPGFVFALFSGLHYALSYMKLGDLYRNESSN